MGTTVKELPTTITMTIMIFNKMKEKCLGYN
jgi:hypothetical protein